MLHTYAWPMHVSGHAQNRPHPHGEHTSTPMCPCRHMRQATQHSPCARASCHAGSLCKLHAQGVVSARCSAALGLSQPQDACICGANEAAPASCSHAMARCQPHRLRWVCVAAVATVPTSTAVLATPWQQSYGGCHATTSGLGHTLWLPPTHTTTLIQWLSRRCQRLSMIKGTSQR